MLLSQFTFKPYFINDLNKQCYVKFTRNIVQKYSAHVCANIQSLKMNVWVKMSFHMILERPYSNAKKSVKLGQYKIKKRNLKILIKMCFYHHNVIVILLFNLLFY